MAAEDVKSTIDEMMGAFEEFKATNDKILADIEKKGAADIVAQEKLARIEAKLAESEKINQQITVQAEQAKRLEEEMKSLNDFMDEIELSLKRPGGGAGQDTAAERKARWNTWLKAAANAIVVGQQNLDEDQVKALADVKAEMKSLNVTNDTAGGYLAPTDYVQEIIKAVVLMSPLRSFVRVRQTAMKSIQVPKRTGTFAAQWVAEQGTKSETTGLAYGLEEIVCPEFYALVDISNQMLEDSAFDMEGELRMEASEQFAVAEGTAFVSGTGVGQPEGLLTNGDVSEQVTGAATTITADSLFTIFYAIKTAYARNATWALNRQTLGSTRKLKDGDGQYLWMPGIAAGQPNTILGAPYVEAPDMPNEGAGLYPILVGDLRRAYSLVDRIAMEMLRDPYTQATSGNVRYIFRRRLGGKVMLAEAVQKLKCSAS